jgi:hypothetical protein
MVGMDGVGAGHGFRWARFALPNNYSGKAQTVSPARDVRRICRKSRAKPAPERAIPADDADCAPAQSAEAHLGSLHEAEPGAIQARALIRWSRVKAQCRKITPGTSN